MVRSYVSDPLSVLVMVLDTDQEIGKEMIDWFILAMIFGAIPLAFIGVGIVLAFDVVVKAIVIKAWGRKNVGRNSLMVELLIAFLVTGWLFGVAVPDMCATTLSNVTNQLC